MLKSLLRVVAAVTVVVAALLSYIQLSFVEQDFPLGSEHRGTILFGESGLSREQVLAGLMEVSRQHDLAIYLEVPGKDDPFNGLDVYAVGHEQPTVPVKINWLSLTRHGSLYPAADLRETNLSAVYTVKGPWEGVTALTRWAESVGAQVSGWGFETPFTMFAAGLVYGAAGIPLVALAVLWVTIVLAWYAARAEARAVRLLAGTPGWRIQAQDMLGWLRVVAPLLLAGVVLATVGVGLARGWGNGLAVGGIVAGYLILMTGLGVVFGVVASIVTAPSVASLALRKPPEARFEFPSQLLRAVALALGLAVLPALLWQAQGSLTQAATQGRVAALAGYVSQGVGGVTEEEFALAYDKLDRFIQAVDATDTLAYAEILTKDSDEVPPALMAAGFDSVAVVNSHYAARFDLHVGTGSLEPIPTEQTEELLKALEEAHVAFIFQDYGLVPDESVGFNICMESAPIFSRNRSWKPGVEEALAKVGLAGRAGDQVAKLSGGERQRVGIARAIFKQARVIFADEPTASLDAANRRMVHELLLGEQDRGATVVISTHDDQLASACDEVVRL